ncbi:MAG: heme-binding protein [Desulfobacteraceae bacterium]|nr:heme-binding protein [Desulfobacteraceae bacterium]
MAEKSWERVWPPEIPYDNSGINLEKALTIIEGAKKKSVETGFSMTFAVCDASGSMIALQKMDDAPLLSIEVAGNKARTAVFGKMPTYLWGDTFRGVEPEIPPLWFHSNWTAFMGGFPIIMENKIIGGLGASGATWEDGIIARAGLLAINADTEFADKCLEAYGIPRDKW